MFDYQFWIFFFRESWKNYKSRKSKQNREEKCKYGVSEIGSWEGSVPVKEEWDKCDNHLLRENKVNSFLCIDKMVVSFIKNNIS